VLRDGQVMASGVPIAEVSRRRLVSLMIGREERIAKVAAAGVPGKVALELRDVATSFGHAGINLRLGKAEILGLYGLVGAGRSELARGIIGDGRITGGTICIGGRPARIRNPREALRRYRIGYVSENRKGEGLFLSHSVVSNIAVTIWRRIATWLGLIGPRVEQNAVTPYVQELAIKIFSLDQTVGTLSGGNQQKVSLAKWLAAKTDILLIDEPTVGIDIKTKTQIHELVAQIARDGVAVLLISSDMAEMITLADRILVVHDFAIVGEVVNDRIYENASQAIIAAIHAAEAKRSVDHLHDHTVVA
jgi:ribose transport system ATP-binding protein